MWAVRRCEMEQKNYAFPISQTGHFGIELIAAAPQALNFAGKSMGLSRPVQGFVAGVAEDRQQFEGTTSSFH